MIGREETVFVLETAIDDMNPELYSYITGKLIGEGALDAYTTPLYMKKGRPANLLTVICREDNYEKLMELIFKETTTMGVRFREERRRVLERSIEEIELDWGKVNIKIGFADKDKKIPVQIAPEYEDCRKIAEEKGAPLKEVYAAARSAAEKLKDY